MKKILLTIAMLSIYLNATPITLNNTGLITKLEKFTPICSYYSKILKHPQHIRQQCQLYKRRLNDILNAGYKLDKNIASKKHTHLYNGKMHTCTEQSHTETSYSPSQIKVYRTKLLGLDKFREQIIEEISNEKSKARRSYDVVYHEKLIRKNVVALYPSDYTFIAEHREIYAEANNPRYIKMLKDRKEELLSQEQRNYLALQRRNEVAKKERENAKWMEECGYTMTAQRHYAKKGGKLTGQVSSSQMNGYFIETQGGIGATFFVQGGPHHTKGEYIFEPMFVTSRGEKIPTVITNNRGVKTKSMALLVHYNDACTKYQK